MRVNNTNSDQDVQMFLELFALTLISFADDVDDLSGLQG